MGIKSRKKSLNFEIVFKCHLQNNINYVVLSKQKK